MAGRPCTPAQPRRPHSAKDARKTRPEEVEAVRAVTNKADNVRRMRHAGPFHEELPKPSSAVLSREKRQKTMNAANALVTDLTQGSESDSD